ncbi:MAG: glycosyltransferase family 4 protein [Nanoarchaeota archaeon]
MKIILCITKSNFGGAQRYVFDLAKAAKKEGLEVKVLCGQAGLLTVKLREEGVECISLPEMWRDVSIVKDIRTFLEIFKTLKKERPNVFHINSSKMGGLGGLAARLAGVKKIVFTSHGWAFNEPRARWQKLFIKLLVWIIILLSHKTICVSYQTKQAMTKWPFIKKKMVVIHNGIEEFELSYKPKEIFTAGAIAELHKIKGLDILLQSWSKFIKKCDAKLIIYGEGEEKDSLQNMARNMGIYDTIEFKGFVDNARTFLPSFDVFILPSRSENLPYAILEAGFAGLPVIATSVGGVPEIIESGISGILIPKEDSEAIFSSLVLLSEDPKLRERLGANLKSTVQENFSIDKMLEKTFKLYF